MVLFDFGFEGAFTEFFYSWGDVAVGGHIDIIGASLGAGGENGGVDEAGAGVDRDKNFLFFDESGEGDGIVGVEFDDFEATVVGFSVEDIGELGFDISEVDIAVAVVGMEALTDDRANPAGPQNKGVFHGHNLLINNNLSFRRNPSSRKGSPNKKVRRKKEFWQGGGNWIWDFGCLIFDRGRDTTVPKLRDALKRECGNVRKWF